MEEGRPLGDTDITICLMHKNFSDKSEIHKDKAVGRLRQSVIESETREVRYIRRAQQRGDLRQSMIDCINSH